MKIAHRTGDLAYETHSFRNAIFGFQNVEFYNGLLDFLTTENDALKTLCFISEICRKSMKRAHRTGHFAYETQGFRNAIFGSQNVEFYKGLLDFLKTENDVQKMLLYKVQIDDNP